MSFSSRKSDLIQYGQNVADEFSWYFDRGLDLNMLDHERAMERKELLDWAKEYADNVVEEGQKQREVLERWNFSRPDTPNRVYQYEVNTLHWLRQKYKSLQDIIMSFDESVAHAEAYFKIAEGGVIHDPDDRPETAWNQSHWCNVWKEWEPILDWIALHNLPLSYAAWLYDHIETKLKCKEITYEHWLKLAAQLICKLAVSEDENHSTMWKDEMLRIAKLTVEFKSRPKPEPKEPEVYFATYDDRTYADMGLDMEAAIDRKRHIEALARANRMDVRTVSDLFDDEPEGMLEHNEHTELIDTLLANNMNKSATARVLGVSRTTVYRRLGKALAKAIN